MKKTLVLSIAALIAASAAASAGETHKKKVHHSGQSSQATTGQATKIDNSSTSPTTKDHSDLSGTMNNPTQQSLQSR